MKKLIPSLVIISGLLLATCTWASVPPLMSYQGKLTDELGVPVPDSTYTMWFRIYSDQSGNDILWEEQQASVSTIEGLFSVLLGSVDSIPDTVFTGTTRYLGIQVSPDAELFPRRPIVSVGYAFRSVRTDTADYAAAATSADHAQNADFSSSAATAGRALRADTADYAFSAPSIPDDDWVISGDTIHHLTGNVGVGIGSPTNRVHIVGAESAPLLNVEKMGSGRGVRVYTTSACALWVANAGNHGLRVTQANGDGVYVENADDGLRVVHADGDGVHVEEAGGWAGYFDGSGYFGGNLAAGTTDPTASLDVNGSTGYDQFRMRTSYTPTDSLDANGNVGDIAWDDHYIYLKTATGWKRAALSAF